jgi:hypothetical protein
MSDIKRGDEVHGMGQSLLSVFTGWTYMTTIKFLERKMRILKIKKEIQMIKIIGKMIYGKYRLYKRNIFVEKRNRKINLFWLKYFEESKDLRMNAKPIISFRRNFATVVLQEKYIINKNYFKGYVKINSFLCKYKILSIKINLTLLNNGTKTHIGLMLTYDVADALFRMTKGKLKKYQVFKKMKTLEEKEKIEISKKITKVLQQKDLILVFKVEPSETYEHQQVLWYEHQKINTKITLFLKIQTQFQLKKK